MRQLLTARLYHPLWIAVLAHGLSSAGFLLWGWLTAIALLFQQTWYQAFLVTLGMLMFQTGLMLMLPWMETAISRIVRARGEPTDWDAELTWWQFARSIIATQWVYTWALIGCLFMRRVHWRGVEYQVVLSTMMHHIPFHLRSTVLQTLTQTNSNIVIIEPLLRTWLSVFLAALSFYLVLLLPIIFIRHPGKLRRVLWCWMVPIVPFMFAWDGVISCLRQWNVAEWQAAFAELPQPPAVAFEVGFNSLKMSWSGVKNRNDAPPASPIENLGAV